MVMVLMVLMVMIVMILMFLVMVVVVVVISGLFTGALERPTCPAYISASFRLYTLSTRNLGNKSNEKWMHCILATVYIGQ